MLDCKFYIERQKQTFYSQIQIILLVIHAILTLLWIFFFFKAEIPLEK